MKQNDSNDSQTKVGDSVSACHAVVDEADYEPFPYIRMWGHAISIDNEKISCYKCGKTEEIPDILSNDSFRDAVYKMYILGGFKNDGCRKMTNDEKVRLRLNDVDTSNIPVKNDRVYWSGSGTESVDYMNRKI